MRAVRIWKLGKVLRVGDGLLFRLTFRLEILVCRKRGFDVLALAILESVV